MFGGNTFASIYFGQNYPVVPIGVSVWVSPANHTTNISALTPVVFLIPFSTTNQHFHLQVDTADTFNTGSLQEFKSSTDQTGWQYWNGSAWVSIPVDGVSNTYIGNQARYTFQNQLDIGAWYRRIRGRITY